MQHDELIWSNIGNKVNLKTNDSFGTVFFRIFARSKPPPEPRGRPSSVEMNTILLVSYFRAFPYPFLHAFILILNRKNISIRSSCEEFPFFDDSCQNSCPGFIDLIFNFIVFHSSFSSSDFCF